MAWITRFFARLLDYTLFFALVLFVLDYVEIDLYYYFFIAIITPILFIPIETILLRLFRTTLGKILFGWRYPSRLSLKETFFISAKKGILIEPLFLPIINIIYSIIYLREIRTYRMKRWDEVSKETLIQKFPRVFPYSLIVGFTLLLGVTAAIPELVYEQVAKVCNIDQSEQALDPSNPYSSNWIKITPEELAFSILFPKEPSYQEINYEVPQSDRVLTFKEYKHVENLEYSLGYVELPRNWTKWGSGIVFKSSLKLLGKVGTVKTRKKSTHRSFPALEYELTHKDGKSLGKLILVKNTLYRLETKYTASPSVEDEKVTQVFFNSFIPKKI